MLEEQDIKKIGDIIDEKVRPIVRSEVSSIVRDEIAPMVKAEVKAGENRVIAAVSEMIEQNVLPFIVNLPDKAYLDEKLANLEGKIVVRERKIDLKINRLIEIQHTRKLISDDDVQELKAIPVFPVAPNLG